MTASNQTHNSVEHIQRCFREVLCPRTPEAPALISEVCQSGQLYSIPEPAKQGLVATESVSGTLRENRKETPMDNSLKQTVRKVCNWLNKKHVFLICVLSVVHIGLSCTHTRDSGRADLCTQGQDNQLH
jgi:hypothetical protein